MACGTGTVTRPVEPWDRVVERGLQQRNWGSGGKTGGGGGTGRECGEADGGAEDLSGETGGSGG